MGFSLVQTHFLVRGLQPTGYLMGMSENMHWVGRGGTGSQGKVSLSVLGIAHLWVQVLELAGPEELSPVGALWLPLWSCLPVLHVAAKQNL